MLRAAISLGFERSSPGGRGRRIGRGFLAGQAEQGETIRYVPAALEAPAAPGAYALWIRLAAPLPVEAGGGAALLAAGDYLYCGSARGPGGLRARLARHMLRRDKRPHWHVDQLTGAGKLLGAWIEIGGSECALNEALADLPVPLPGFGSSDCKRCVAHLRFFPAFARLPSQWENARKTAEKPAPERKRHVEGRKEIQS
jgi:histidyl-tRNA synthetase